MEEKWAGQAFVLEALKNCSADPEKLEFLKEQLSQIDPEDVEKMMANIPASSDDAFQPFEPIFECTNEQQQSEWSDIGLDAIRNGQVAAVLLAGGQGTRLGTTDPKGTFDFGLISHKCLFHIQAERIQNLMNKTSGKIPWYIMTSDATHQATVTFFTEHNFFGLEKDDVLFFKQRNLPAVNEEGQILLANPYQIYEAPNGNGGVYDALAKGGMIDDMERRGIKVVFIYGVDNALVRIADPVFVGSFIQSGKDWGSKVVPKKSADERAGIFCVENETSRVIEYTEISHELSHRVNDQGQLVFNATNIVTHIFTFNSLRKLSGSKALIYHKAKKAVPAYNPITKQTESIEGMKFEKFVFDVFQHTPKEQMFLYNCPRNQEFSPIKNKEGNDSPKTALDQISNLHRSWLEAAGAIIEGDDICEISPLVSYGGENLEGYRGKTLQSPVNLTK